MTLTPNWLVAPVVIPMIFAALGLLRLRRNQYENLAWQRNLAIVATILNLVIALTILQHTLTVGRISLQVGNWQAPFGITLLADGLTGIMLSLTAILAATIVPFSIKTMDDRQRLNFYPLILFLVMGVNGAFLAGDLFNLYVFFEVLLMTSFVLLTVGGQMRQINSGIRYVVLNLLASTLFLAAAGIAYGTLGTLNMAHLAQRLEFAPPHIRLLMAGLLLVAFGSKAGLFPLFFWLPSSYHTTHPVVTAFFGGLLTKVGIYTLFRIFPLFFPELLVAWQPLLLWMAGFTMLVGVLGAMAANTIRRVLSFHIISHVGFMIMGLGVAASGNTLPVGFGMAAAILYLAHHMIVKTALLMAGGTVELEMGSGSLTNGKLGGLMQRRPVLAVLFFLAAMSLAGIPPFSGFVSKLSLLEITLDTGHWWVAGVSVLVSVFTLMNMARLWQVAFWGTSDQPEAKTAPLSRPGGQWLTLGPIALLVALSLTMGIFGQTVFHYANVAAAQVMDRQGYIAQIAPTDEIPVLSKPVDGGH